ncbi:hypothetical protein [Actinoplanes aureus]|uniref:Uncharacterized protein n=1 Tax=Actinoplanes aureus TaxID=2792083 RepID=A0A931CAA7_9ACTN|nr:hypothetical protein [Actinoplanes aureus]MBG0565039.1 hypothetical protein [Actinoplanes aureus]
MSLDERLAATLAAHAGADPDPAPIVERARHRGRRLKRRRRGLIGLGAAAVCAVVAAVFLVPQSGPVRRADAVLLPAAPGRPGAADRPDLVGTDPWTLHFTADDLVAGAGHVEWKAGGGFESVEYWGPGGHGRLLLAQDTDTLDPIKQALSSTASIEYRSNPTEVRVAGRPGTARFEPNGGGPDLWVVRWEPLDGLWARLEVYANGQDAAIAVAERFRYDGARRCAVPFRLTELPAGSRTLVCSVQLGATFIEGTLVVNDDTRRWVSVRAQLTEDEGPAEVRRRGERADVLEKRVEPFAVEAHLSGLGNTPRSYTEEEGRAILNGVRPNGDPDEISTW